MTYRRVFLSAAGLDGPHHHFAGVGADSDLNRRTAVRSQLVTVAAQILLHSERREQRALRMVLMGDWCAEQRENSVAGALDDVTVVAAHRVDHQLERGIDNRASFFWI